jgi:hypothetical protein
MSEEKRVTEERPEVEGKLHEGGESRQGETPDVEGHVARVAPPVDHKSTQKHARRF